MKKLMAGLVGLSVLAGVCALPASAADKKEKPTPEERFKKADKNGDEKLSYDEFKGKQKDEEKLKTLKETFEKKDKDKDGFLTLEEFKAPAKKKKNA